jgi:hypothetical protein
LPARPPSGFCWAHDPEHAERRKELAAKAGKSKKDPAITELNQRIREVLDNVLLGEVDRADASVFFQGAGVLIRGLEQARRNRETDELAREIAEIREQLDDHRSGRWAN